MVFLRLLLIQILGSVNRIHIVGFLKPTTNVLKPTANINRIYTDGKVLKPIANVWIYTGANLKRTASINTSFIQEISLMLPPIEMYLY